MPHLPVVHFEDDSFDLPSERMDAVAAAGRLVPDHMQLPLAEWAFHT